MKAVLFDEFGDAEVLRLAEAPMPEPRPGDLLVLSADHGCDPSWAGSDHTRERVPVVGVVAGSPGAGARGLVAFADVGATVASHLGVPAQGPGRAFL